MLISDWLQKVRNNCRFASRRTSKPSQRQRAAINKQWSTAAETLETRIYLSAVTENPLVDGHSDGHDHEHGVPGQIIAEGESRLVIGPHHDDPGHPGPPTTHFFAETGDEHHFAWQDQDLSTPDVIDIYYDFRDVGSFSNLITPGQMARSRDALDAWEAATSGGVKFTQNTSAPNSDIVNIGSGDLAALGGTSGPGGTLGLGGGVFTHDANHTITAGIAWQDSQENWDDQFNNGNPTGTIDYFTVVAQEIGHGIGLGHTSDIAGPDLMDGIYSGEQTTASVNDIEHILVLYGAGPAGPGPGPGPSDGAIVVEPTSDTNDLLNALIGSAGGITVTSISVQGHTGVGGESSTGTYSILDTNAYGLITDGIIISSGDVEDYESGPNNDSGNTTAFGVFGAPATAAQEALLDPITGGSFDHYDATQIDIIFNTEIGFDSVNFDVVFGSEEWPEFVDTLFDDGFGLYVNGINIADVNGLPVNIDHPDMQSLPETELDGVLAPGGVARQSFSYFVGEGTTGNVLSIILADTGGGILDSTVYISSLAGLAVPPDDHGNNSGQATNVGVNSSTPGDIEYTNDQDWFRFGASAGQTYVFETTAGSLSDTLLALFDKDGTTVLAIDDDSGLGAASRIEWTAQSSGSHYLRVNGFSDTKVGTYTLNISTVGDPVLTTPVLLTPGAATTDTRPDFSWTAVVGAVAYELRVDNFTSGSQNVIHEVTPYTEFSPSFDLANDETYRWQVRAISAVGNVSNWSSEQNLFLSGGADDHGLNPVNATVVGTGTWAGNIESTGDEDFFSIDVQAGTAYTFEIERGTLLESQITLYNDSVADVPVQLDGTLLADMDSFLYGDLFDSVLTTAINNLATTVVLNVREGFRFEPGTIILIDSELMEVVGSGGGRITVVRGFGGTTIAAHLIGRPVESQTMFVWDATAFPSIPGFEVKIDNEVVFVYDIEDFGGTRPRFYIDRDFYAKVNHFGSTNPNSFELFSPSVINVGEVTLQLDDVSGFPTTMPFYIQIATDSFSLLTGETTTVVEIFEVTSVDTFNNTLTANRAVAGTSAIPHFMDDLVTNRTRFSEDSPINGNSRIQFVPTTSGTLFLKVESNDGISTGTYSLNIDGIDPDRNGDTAVDATLIELGTLDAEIVSHRDVDWFEFVAPSTQTFVFETTLGTLDNTIMALYGRSDLSVAIADTVVDTVTVDDASVFEDLVAPFILRIGDEQMRVTSVAGNTFTVERGVNVTSASTHAIGAPVIAELASDDNSGVGAASRIEWDAEAGEQVVVFVDGFDGRIGKYSITVSGINNDDHANGPLLVTGSDVIALGDSTVNEIERPGDVDWFKFDAAAGSQNIFETFAGTLTDSVLTLYASDGTTVLATDDDGGTGSMSRIDWTAIDTEFYFLKVEAFESSATGTYTLRFDSIGVDDHANDNSTTSSVVVNDQPTAGILEEQGDVDWFKIDLTSSHDYVFETILGSLSDTTLELYDPTGNLVSSNDDGGQGNASRITYTASETGTFFLQVAAKVSSQTGSYLVSSRDIGTDDGDVANTATAIAIDSSTATLIDVARDEDWFSFETVANVKYSADIDLGTLPAGTLTLLDEDGTTELLFTDGDLKGQIVELEWISPTTGTSFLKVTGLGSSQIGTYTLNLNQPTSADVGVPELSAPGGILLDTRLPTFTWSTASRAVRYELIVDDLSTGEEGVISESNLTETTFTATEPLVNGRVYRWSVQAFDVNNVPGDVSISKSFILLLQDDHGDTSLDSTTISGNSITPGEIEVPGDQDWFNFTALTDTTYHLSVSSGTLSDMTFSLVDTDGATVLDFDQTDTDTTTPEIWFETTTQGTFYLKVQPEDLTNIGSYTVNLVEIADDHGDDSDTATNILPNSNTNGVIEDIQPVADQDWFSFEATAGARYLIDTTLGTLPASIVTLFDTDGQSVLAFDNDSVPVDPTASIVSKIINGDPTNEFASVGIFTDEFDTFGCTATLISPTHVLTAAHCADGLLDTEGRFIINNTTYQSTNITLHPDWRGFLLGQDGDNDLAIIELSQAVPGIAPSPILRNAPSVGDDLILVGFGAGGDGDTGSDGTFGTKRVGTTPIDSLTSELIFWSFDDNSESNTAPGDSGGPAFLEIDGQTFIAGVTSGGFKADASIGDFSFDTRIDAYQQWIESITGPLDVPQSSSRIEFTAPDDGTYFIRMTASDDTENGTYVLELAEILPVVAVSQIGSTVYVEGSTVQDDIKVILGESSIAIVADGTTQTFDLSTVSTITLDGAGGNDSLTVIGSSRNEKVTLQPGSLSLTSYAVNLNANGFEEIDVNAKGGFDKAKIYGTTGNDVFIATPTAATMKTDGSTNTVRGFERVAGYAVSGTNDVAKMYDSATDDVFVASPAIATFAGNGFKNIGRTFDNVKAYSLNGGTDKAILNDSNGDDTFTATPDYALMQGKYFRNYVRGFERVDGQSRFGGNDTAILFDSNGDDRYASNATLSVLFGAGFKNYARGFNNVIVEANAGGNDRTVLKEISSLDSVFGENDVLTLTRSNRVEQISGFDRASAQANDGETPTANVQNLDLAFTKIGNWQEL